MEINSFDQQILQETHAAFRYVVDIKGVPVGAFTECTLPVMEIETEEVKEGGQNQYIHELPGRRKSARMTLKNGLGKNELVEWCVKSLTERFERKEITVILYSARGKDGQDPICTWTIEGAYPIKWTGPQLQADSNTIAIQTVEFVCRQVEMTIGSPVVD